MYGERGRTGLFQNVRSFSCPRETEMRMQGACLAHCPPEEGEARGPSGSALRLAQHPEAYLVIFSKDVVLGPFHSPPVLVPQHLASGGPGSGQRDGICPLVSSGPVALALS